MRSARDETPQDGGPDTGIHGETGLDGTSLLPTVEQSKKHLDRWEGEKAVNKIAEVGHCDPLHALVSAAFADVFPLRASYPCFETV
jgi:hypothetical protein